MCGDAGNKNEEHAIAEWMHVDQSDILLFGKNEISVLQYTEGTIRFSTTPYGFDITHTTRQFTPLRIALK